MNLTHEVKVYVLTNASPDLVEYELKKLYPKQRFATNMRTNAIIVSGDVQSLGQIDNIIKHFDRANTDMVEISTDQSLLKR